MNIDRGKTEFTAEELVELRQRLTAYRADAELSWSQLADQLQIPAGTLQPWCAGTYKGDVQRYAAIVWKWFLAEAEREQLELEAPIIPGFQRTQTAVRIHSQLRWAHRGRIVLIVGTAGTGKTSAFRQYTADNASAFLVTASRATRSPAQLLEEITLVIGRTERRWGNSLHNLFHTICDRLANARALLIVDEAQHLQDDTLDQLRAIHDAIGVGVALGGNPEVSTRINGVTRNASFAQLHSRISMSATYSRPDQADVDLLLNAWGVKTPKMREFLTRLAAQPGCLRTITQVLELATLTARQEDDELSLDRLQHAWRLHGRQLLAVS